VVDPSLPVRTIRRRKGKKEERMKRVIVLLTAIFLAAITLSPLPAAAKGDTHVTGGGTGTFDGVNPGSQFGMGVNILGGGSAKGHFECLMAGGSAVPGLHLMAVEGKVTAGSASVALGTATFSGLSTVNFGDGGKVTGVPFTVTVTGGGPGVGTLTLTVTGFDGGPGDTILGNGQLDLPTETVSTGQIKVH